MSHVGGGMEIAWWRFGVDGGICLGVAMGFVGVVERWGRGLLAL
jgi:hypothetical protein